MLTFTEPLDIHNKYDNKIFNAICNNFVTLFIKQSIGVLHIRLVD